MHLWALLFLFLTNLTDEPRRICLPIQIREASPVQFAMNTLRHELEDHQNSIEISCSQPDYQLFYSVDKSLRNEDDFILIISDVNIEISGGSERGVMYGLLEFLHQLEAKKFKISDVRSVVSHPNTRTRGLIIDYQHLNEGGPGGDWNRFLDEMAALRFNHLVVRRKASAQEQAPPLDQSLIDEVHQLTKFRSISFVLQDFLADTLTNKGLVVNAGTVTRAQFSGAGYQLGNRLADFARLSKIKNFPTIVIDINEKQVHSFSNWHQRHWWRVFSTRNRVPQEVLLDCTDSVFCKRDSPDFLTRYHRYFWNWSSQLEQAVSFAPMGLLERHDPCFSTALEQAVKAAEQASSILRDCFSDDHHWFDWKTFQRIDKFNQGHFYDITEIMDDQLKGKIFLANGQTTENGSLRQVIDTLRQLQRVITINENVTCDQPELQFLKMDMGEFTTCLSYAIYKLESAFQLFKYADTKKRNYKVQALRQISLANDIWRRHWSSTGPSGAPLGSSRASWIRGGMQDAETIKKFRN